MSWLYDKKPTDDKSKDPNDWGYACGHCGLAFQDNYPKYFEHISHKENCKGGNVRYSRW